MMKVITSIAILLYMQVGNITAQFHFKQPSALWRAIKGDPIRDNNGVFISPDDEVLIVSRSSGQIDAYDPFGGTQLWSFVPTPLGSEPIGCNSGVTFSYTGDSQYLVYSIVEDLDGESPFTRVFALSPDGQLLWYSSELEGENAGSPVVGFDGQYVYLTHNSNYTSTGHFTVLDTSEATASDPVGPLFTEIDTTNPYSPPGIYHNPVEGYFDGGEGNTNDVVMWSYAPNPTEDSVGIGGMFAFQLPMEDGDMSSGLRVLPLGSTRNWQSVSPPVLANNGRSLYWGVSRSQFRAWVGEEGMKMNYFSRTRTSAPGFSRGRPAYQAVFNKPALSHGSPSRPMIFAGTASTEFVKMDYLMSNAIVYETSDLVKSTAIVSPDDSRVYFSEYSGLVHQVDSKTLSDKWTLSSPSDFIDGEMALNSMGTILYIGFASGEVKAYQVALPATPSVNHPSMAPSMLPSFVDSASQSSFGPSFVSSSSDIPTMDQSVSSSSESTSEATSTTTSE